MSVTVCMKKIQIDLFYVAKEIRNFASCTGNRCLSKSICVFVSTWTGVSQRREKALSSFLASNITNDYNTHFNTSGKGKYN